MDLITDILSYEFNRRALLAAVMIGFMNGYVGGYASAAQLADEIDSLGLSPSAQEHLWQTVRRFKK